MPVVVESPAEAKTISMYPGADPKVGAFSGASCDLPPEKGAVVTGSSGFETGTLTCG